MAIVLLVLGLVVLTAGAELLVRGAARLAAALGVSPLVIGLTVVAFGTGAPEMAVSIGASLGGQPDIAVGNVVGSNILNVLIVLGLSAAIAPLMVASRLVRIDVPILIGVSILVLALALDGRIGRWDGLVLVAGMIAYTVFAILFERGEGQAAVGQSLELGAAPRTPRALALNAGLVVVGLALLVLGARWMVTGAVEVARAIGVSELVIGLTVVAVGTSLPEIATSAMAALRGERDIAVGNVVGSNLFNLLAVLGAAAALAPEGIGVAPAVLAFDLPVMIAAAVACLPIFFTGARIARWEGMLFLGYYAAYTAFLVLAAAEHDALDAFSTVMLAFVVPLTVLTVAVTVVEELRLARKRGAAKGDRGD